MAIRVGQIRKGDNNYITQMSGIELTTVETTGVNRIFDDFAIKGSFEKGKTYYIRLQFKRIEINEPMGSNTQAGDNDPHNLNLDVKLFEDANNPQSVYQSIGETLLIEPYYNEDSSSTLAKQTAFVKWCERNLANGIDMNEDADDYWQVFKSEYEAKEGQSDQNINLGYSPIKTIELIFTPYLNTAQALVFQLRRVSYDYTVTPRIVEVVDSTISDYDVATVSNILPNIIADKIGIQTRPGSLVVINQEPMRVGKSGVLEINNGIKVTSVGMVAPQNSINDFLLDYIYTVE